MTWGVLKEIFEVVGAIGAIVGGVAWLSSRFASIDTKLNDIMGNHLAHIYHDIDEIHQYMFGQKK